MEKLTCPFCDFGDHDPYFLAQHVELVHPENGESPFIVNEDDHGAYQNDLGATTSLSRQDLPSTATEQTKYVDCPHGCGERVPATELVYHTDFHVAEGMALDEGSLSTHFELSTGQSNDQQVVGDNSNAFTTDIPESLRNYDQLRSKSPRGEKRHLKSFKHLVLGTPPMIRVLTKPAPGTKGKGQRLGSAELGPYAHESQMPPWLRKMLEEGAKVTITNKIGPDGNLVKIETIANETSGLIAVLARLSHLDSTVEEAYYCSPNVRHVAKMPREGGFCGYRNIQMLISYIQDANAKGHEYFEESRLPSILRLQDQIEHAWEMGYNSSGKIETGGIRMTRKYIGTPEAQALFLSLGIECEANGFINGGKLHADESLVLAIAGFFQSDREASEQAQGRNVFITDKPPIYFQHKGHSMTIVGLEVRTNGAVNLVVFDPMFNPSPAMKKLAERGDTRFRTKDPGRLIRAHRRGLNYLAKYNEFEILRLVGKSGDGVDSVAK